MEQQQRAAAAVPKAPHYGARPGGVLQPAKAPRYPRGPRKQGSLDTTKFRFKMILIYLTGFYHFVIGYFFGYPTEI